MWKLESWGCWENFSGKDWDECRRTERVYVAVWVWFFFGELKGKKVSLLKRAARLVVYLITNTG